MFKIFTVLFLFFSASPCFSYGSTGPKSALSKYHLNVNNTFKDAIVQNYTVYFISPEVRNKAVLDAKSLVDSRIARQKKKFKNKPDKLKRELQESKYLPIADHTWDSSMNEVIVLAVATLIPAQGIPIRTNAQGTKVKLLDKDGVSICEPKRNFHLNKSVRVYLAQVYGGAAFTGKIMMSSMDNNYLPLMSTFDPKCFDVDYVKLEIESKAKVNATKKISKSLLKRIRAAY